MKPHRFELLGLPCDSMTMTETVHHIDSHIQSRKPLLHCVVNAAKMVKAQKDTLLKQSITEADLVNIDGQAVVWAARLLGNTVPERVAGVDLMKNLLILAENKNYSVYFLGATDTVINKLIQQIKIDYPKLKIAGHRNGYFELSSSDFVIDQINHAKPDLLFVGMPTPRKEIFIDKNFEQLSVPFVMGVGGSFDVLSGTINRAPLIMQKMGFEWLYRLAQEPRRMFIRYLKGNTLFSILIMKAWFHQRFLKPSHTT